MCGVRNAIVLGIKAIAPHFSHAESIVTGPVDFQLRTLVMPAITERFILEAEAGHPKHDDLWETEGNEPVAPILDAGAIQFKNGHLRLGQITRVKTGLRDSIDPTTSETTLRTALALSSPNSPNSLANGNPAPLPSAAITCPLWAHCPIAPTSIFSPASATPWYSSPP
ncbi:MAG: hypothetical protein HC860_12080 [Alkalinema sp. RU_4_3]|nr:hypothetical protein [Alkalinema sp. RU_4_3]